MASRQGLTVVLTMCGMAMAQVAVPTRAWAQSAPKLAISAAAGLSNPLHGDFDFTAPEWQISLRTAVSDHFLLEGFLDEWRHTTDEVFENQTLFDPNGIIGRAGRVTTRTVHATKVVGFNALARATVDRVTLTAGGGPGFWLYDRRYSQTVTDCQSSLPTSCRDSANRFSNSSFSVQGVAGLEVAITSRLAAFGQFQFMAPTVDLAGGHVTVGGGVRLRIW